MSNEKVKRYWGPEQDMESLAAIVRQRKNQSPGVNFARSQFSEPWKDGKDDARAQILGLLSPLRRKTPISILTMPGITWHFEKNLLKLREPELAEGKVSRTSITSIEREPPIFVAALKDIPGADRGLEHLPDDFMRSTCTMKTPFIKRFHLTTFEEFAEVNTRLYTDAWLDFTGPLTERLLETIPYFWKHIECTLTITTLNARWDRRTSNKVKRAGGAANLLMETLDQPLHFRTDRYIDTVPMIQTIFAKEPAVVPA
jgi:hypothetical protein